MSTVEPNHVIHLPIKWTELIFFKHKLFCDAVTKILFKFRVRLQSVNVSVLYKDRFGKRFKIDVGYLILSIDKPDVFCELLSECNFL